MNKQGTGAENVTEKNEINIKKWQKNIIDVKKM